VLLYLKIVDEYMRNRSLPKKAISVPFIQNKVNQRRVTRHKFIIDVESTKVKSNKRGISKSWLLSTSKCSKL
jgi:hypothetical protein